MKPIKINLDGMEDMPEVLKDALMEAVGDSLKKINAPIGEEMNALTPEQAVTLLQKGFGQMDEKHTFAPGDLVVGKPGAWTARTPPGGVMLFRRYEKPERAKITGDEITSFYAVEAYDCVTGWLCTGPRGDVYVVEFYTSANRLQPYVEGNAGLMMTLDGTSVPAPEQKASMAATSADDQLRAAWRGGSGVGNA